MVNDPNVLRTRAVYVLKCIFITVLADINGNTCVILKKTFQGISLCKKNCFALKKKSHLNPYVLYSMPLFYARSLSR